MSEWVYRIVNADGQAVKGDGLPGKRFYSRRPVAEVNRLNIMSLTSVMFKQPFVIEKGFCRFSKIQPEEETG